MVALSGEEMNVYFCIDCGLTFELDTGKKVVVPETHPVMNILKRCFSCTAIRETSKQGFKP